MNIALLLKSELRRSAGILAGMALIIALALSIAVAAGICERMGKASAGACADDFDLLIGARGSSSALLLGTVFLRDEMLPIVPASAWANIREAQTAKSSIRWAAPVAFGDRTPSGRTIVGTTRSFLERGKSRKPFFRPGARAATPLPGDFSQSRLKPLRAPPQAMSSETNFPLCTAEFMALATHMRALLTKWSAFCRPPERHGTVR